MKFIRDREKSWPLGQPTGEIGRVRVVDTRSHSAIAQVEFSAIPSTREMSSFLSWKTPVSFHVPGRFDRFAPANGKLTGARRLGKDFDGVLGTGMNSI